MLDLFAALADGKLWRFPDAQAQRQANAKQASLSQQAKVAIGRKDVGTLEKILRQTDEILNSAPVPGMTVAPRTAEIAEIVKDAVCFDVTAVDRMLRSDDCEIPDIAELPPVRIPHHTTLFLMSAAPYSQYETTIWWLMTDTDNPTTETCGLFTKGPNGGIAVEMSAGLPGKDGNDLGREGTEAYREAVMRLATLLTTCKNVGSRTVLAPRPWRRRRERDGLPASNGYHVLELFPRARRETSGNGESNGTPKRLHSVRGHFKHTRHGTFWWHPHWRGRPDRGVVVKDYAIAPRALEEIGSHPKD